MDACLDDSGLEVRRGGLVQLCNTLCCGREGHVGTVLHIHEVPVGWDGKSAAMLTVWWPGYGTISTHHWSCLCVVNTAFNEGEGK